MHDRQSKSEIISAAISRLESLLLIEPDDLTLARKYLEDLLLTFGKTESGPTLEEVIVMVASTTSSPDVAAVLLRCTAFPGLLPESSKSNQIQRHITAACERLHPDFLSFLRIDKADQTYQKYQSLTGLHERIGALLAPLKGTYGDLQSLLNAQKDIIGALSHSIVRSYGSPFFLNEARSAVELIYSRLQQVGLLSSSLLTDLLSNHERNLPPSGRSLWL